MFKPFSFTSFINTSKSLYKYGEITKTERAMKLYKAFLEIDKYSIFSQKTMTIKEK